MAMGEKLKALMKSKGISQDRLAVVMDVSQTTIANWTKDDVDIPMSRSLALAKYFGVTLDQLADPDVPLP